MQPSAGIAKTRPKGRKAILALLWAAGFAGCADYQQTTSATKAVYDIAVTTRRSDVQRCRLIGTVDSRDSARGCGLTVQPTPEECLRYQVARAGGDTLLMNGPIGEAYDCGLKHPTAEPTAQAPAAAATPKIPAPATPVSAPAEAPTPVPVPVPQPAPTGATAPAGVRIVPGREAVRGCVYLDEVDLQAACPTEAGRTPTDCAVDRAARAGGNAVLIEATRAQIYACKTP